MYSFSDHQKTTMRANPQNRINALQAPPALFALERQLIALERVPAMTGKEIKEKQGKLLQLRRDIEGRRSHVDLYKELFPDMFDGDAIKKAAK